MLTTDGVTAFAMFLKVCASIGPLIGALFMGGAAVIWADESGVRPSLELTTIPTAIDATAMSSP
jgi:hypothetical protein